MKTKNDWIGGTHRVRAAAIITTLDLLVATAVVGVGSALAACAVESNPEEPVAAKVMLEVSNDRDVMALAYTLERLGCRFDNSFSDFEPRALPYGRAAVVLDSSCDRALGTRTGAGLRVVLGADGGVEHATAFTLEFTEGMETFRPLGLQNGEVVYEDFYSWLENLDAYANPAVARLAPGSPKDAVDVVTATGGAVCKDCIAEAITTAESYLSTVEERVTDLAIPAAAHSMLWVRANNRCEAACGGGAGCLAVTQEGGGMDCASDTRTTVTTGAYQECLQQTGYWHCESACDPDNYDGPGECREARILYHDCNKTEDGYRCCNEEEGCLDNVFTDGAAAFTFESEEVFQGLTAPASGTPTGASCTGQLRESRCYWLSAADAEHFQFPYATQICAHGACDDPSQPCWQNSGSFADTCAPDGRSVLPPCHAGNSQTVIEEIPRGGRPEMAACADDNEPLYDAVSQTCVRKQLKHYCSSEPNNNSRYEECIDGAWNGGCEWTKDPSLEGS